jgi:hypothetical protein
MVLKRSKYDLNTGNTLRNHNQEVAVFSRGTVHCKVDEYRINEAIDWLHSNLNNTSNADIHYDLTCAIVTLENICDIFGEIGSGSSLSKRSRWLLFDLLLRQCTVLNNLSAVITELDIGIHVVEEFGLWKSCDIIPLHQQSQAVITKCKKSPAVRQHDRGIQRRMNVSKRQSYEGEYTK